MTQVSVGSGRYRATLHLGTVTKGFWSPRQEERAVLQWVIPGPDGRYNPGIAQLDIAKADSFKRAVTNAFEAWESLVRTVPDDVTVTKGYSSVGFGFTLITAGWHRGVTPFPQARFGPALAIADRAALDDLVGVVSLGQRRAVELRHLA